MNSIFSSCNYSEYHPLFSNTPPNSSTAAQIEEPQSSNISTGNPQSSFNVEIPTVLINNILKCLGSRDKINTSFASRTLNNLTKQHFLLEIPRLRSINRNLLETLIKSFISQLREVLEEVNELKNDDLFEEFNKLNIPEQLMELIERLNQIYNQSIKFNNIDQILEEDECIQIKNILTQLEVNFSNLEKEISKRDLFSSEKIRNISLQINFKLFDHLKRLIAIREKYSKLYIIINSQELFDASRNAEAFKALEKNTLDIIVEVALDENTQNDFLKLLPKNFRERLSLYKKVSEAKNENSRSYSQITKDICLKLIELDDLRSALEFAKTIQLTHIRSFTLLKISAFFLTINKKNKALEIARKCEAAHINDTLSFCKELIDRNLIPEALNIIRTTQLNELLWKRITKELMEYLLAKNTPETAVNIIRIVTFTDNHSYDHNQYKIHQTNGLLICIKNYKEKGISTDTILQILEVSLSFKNELPDYLADSLIDEIIKANEGSLEWFCDISITTGNIKSAFYAAQKSQNTTFRLEIVTRIVQFYKEEGNFNAAIKIVRDASIDDDSKRNLFIIIFELLKREQNYQKNTPSLKKLSESFNSLSDIETAFNVAKSIRDNVNRKHALLNVFDTLVNQKNLSAILRYITLIENSSDKEHILWHVAKKIDKRLISVNQLFSMLHEDENIIEGVFSLLVETNNFKIAAIIADESNFVKEKIKRFMVLSKILIQNGKFDQLFKIINSLKNKRDKIMIFQNLSRYLFSIQNYRLSKMAIDSISDEYDQGLAIINIIQDLLESDLEKAQTLIEGITHAGLKESALSLLNKKSSRVSRN